jgi:GT2 family glycosyltransferase
MPGDDHAGVMVVTVTCGQRPRLLEESLRAALAGGAGRCVVVHNTSESPDERFYARLEDELGGRLILCPTGENSGSAGGYRRGLETAGSLADCEYIWLLDDDNLPERGALAALMAKHRELRAEWPRDGIALVSLRPDREYLARVAAGAPPETVFPRRGSFMGFHWRDVPRKLRRLLGGAPPAVAPRGDGAVEIPFAPYGGLFLHKSVLARIGLPDERFFLYGDDMEYTNRLVEQGGRLFLIPPSRVADADSSLRAETRGRNAISRLLLAESAARVFYSVRNQVYFETRCWKGGALEYLFNKLAFFVVLGLAATWHGRWARAALIRRAARLGRQGRLGRADELPGP